MFLGLISLDFPSDKDELQSRLDEAYAIAPEGDTKWQLSLLKNRTVPKDCDGSPKEITALWTFVLRVLHQEFTSSGQFSKALAADYLRVHNPTPVTKFQPLTFPLETLGRRLRAAS